ncbi:MAG TPA: exo-alpha-sialidase [Candidatus Competibacter sp.]|nr:exo-alpha-sialidase [Candidatus Competibacteraceae bacterium]HPE70683.1 exo-alpha-sialidase [Candidatus Competibacter sp.]
MQKSTVFLAFLLSFGTMSAHAAESPAFAAFMKQAGHIHGIAVNPSEPSQLYLATHRGLYLASPDGKTVQVSDANHDFMGFAVHPTEPNQIYGSGHPVGGGNLGFIASTDGGKTWRQLSPGVKGPVDFHAMAISNADPKVMYGLYGSIQVSRDGGHTWAIAGPAPGKVIDLAASATDAQTVYAGTVDGVLESKDGGRSWQPAYLITRPAPLVEVDKDGAVYVFMVGVGFLKRQGHDWTRLASAGDFGEGYFTHLAIDPNDAQRLYATTSTGELLASIDGGQHWQPFAQNL